MKRLLLFLSLILSSMFCIAQKADTAWQTGPKDGQYYYTKDGHKVYRSSASYSTPPTSAVIQTGPKGGQYYIDDKGNKKYVKRK